jgi:hypothetical protein
MQCLLSLLNFSGKTRGIGVRTASCAVCQQKHIRKSSSVILDRLHLQAECCSQNVVKSVGKNCLQHTAVVVTLGEATVYLQH